MCHQYRSNKGSLVMFNECVKWASTSRYSYFETMARFRTVKRAYASCFDVFTSAIICISHYQKQNYTNLQCWHTIGQYLDRKLTFSIRQHTKILDSFTITIQPLQPYICLLLFNMRFFQPQINTQKAYHNSTKWKWGKWVYNCLPLGQQ